MLKKWVGTRGNGAKFKGFEAFQRLNPSDFCAYHVGNKIAALIKSSHIVRGGGLDAEVSD